MLTPIAAAVASQAGSRKLTVALLLAVAYGANIGGIGTPIGTPPNLLFIDAYEKATGTAVGFFRWMSWTVPIIVVFIPLAALYLTRGLRGRSAFQIPRVGPWRVAEKRVLLVFAATALLWITRDMGGIGWKTVPLLAGAKDSSVALLAAVALFLIGDGKGGRLLDWKSASQIPWGIFLLFAAGLCIGIAFRETGLSGALALQLEALNALPILVIVFCICLGVTLLTEITSNTATTAILMTILPAAAGSDDRLLYFMLPAALSASCAFMLPVATAPNAIVYSRGAFPVSAMLRNGAAVSLIGAVVISSASYLGGAIFAAG